MTDVVVRDVTMRYGEQVVLSHFSHRFSALRDGAVRLWEDHASAPDCRTGNA